MVSERNLRFFAVLTMVVLFVAGVGIGFSISQLMFKPKEHQPPPRHGPNIGRMLDRFARDLDLTTDQKEAIHRILEEGRLALEKQMEEDRPKLNAIQKSLEERIAAILNPEQRERYRKLVERGQGLPSRHHPGPHGGPPGHRGGPPGHPGGPPGHRGGPPPPAGLPH